MRISFSFDYELAWGTYEMIGPRYLETNVRFSNDAALRVLRMHEEFGIPATWGLVGAAIANESLEARLETCRGLGAPVDELVAQLAQVNEEIALDVTTIPAEFKSALQASSIQKAGCHTFAHMYAPTATATNLNEDLRLAVAALSEQGFGHPRLLIAPKNLVTAELQAAARSAGISTVRVNPSNWLYRTSPMPVSPQKARVIRLLRYSDSFLPVNEWVDRKSEPLGLLEDEGNLFLRPSLSSRAFQLHLRRLRSWLNHCEVSQRNVHVWCHPHNFGPDLGHSLETYRTMLVTVASWASSRDVEFDVPQEPRGVA